MNFLKAPGSPPKKAAKAPPLPGVPLPKIVKQPPKVPATNPLDQSPKRVRPPATPKKPPPKQAPMTPAEAPPKRIVRNLFGDGIAADDTIVQIRFRRSQWDLQDAQRYAAKLAEEEPQSIINTGWEWAFIYHDVDPLAALRLNTTVDGKKARIFYIRTSSPVGRGLYQTLVNPIRKTQPGSRPLLDGERHPPIPGYNFCGPGTRMDLPHIANTKPINEVDSVCRQHDIAYERSKNLRKQGKIDEAGKIIKEADTQMLAELQRRGKTRNLPYLGIKAKVKAEKSSIGKKAVRALVGEEFVGSGVPGDITDSVQAILDAPQGILPNEPALNVPLTRILNWISSTPTRKDLKDYINTVRPILHQPGFAGIKWTLLNMTFLTAERVLRSLPRATKTSRLD